MSTIRDEFEALLPEPVATVDADGFLVVLSGGYIPTHAKLYTAAQMRAMFDAATERAAKQEREECAKLCESLKSNWNYCAAAIRAREDGVAG
jgi:hypothetical protein